MGKRAVFILTALGLLLFAHQVCAQEYFTLEMALERVEYHADYIAWRKNIENIADSIEAIRGRQKPGLSINGQPISLSTGFKPNTTGLSTSASLAYSQKFLTGTSLAAGLSANKDFLSDRPWSIRWSFSLDQTVWPSPKLSTERLNLIYNENCIEVLERQGEYIVWKTLFKIEELYQQTLAIQTRLKFAEYNLKTAREAAEIVKAKEVLGEVGKSEELTAQINLLKAEKELEQAQRNAVTALEKLQEALALEDLPLLPPWQGSEGQEFKSPLPVAGYPFPLQEHPLLLQRLLDIERANLELKAAREGLKPTASLAFRLGEAQSSGDLQVSASLSVSYGILDGGQKKKTVTDKEESLASVRQTYEESLTGLMNTVEETLYNIESKGRDLEISLLGLAKAQLELEGARRQFSVGSLDASSLERQEMQYLQARLNYWESEFQYDLLVGRFLAGILGDLQEPGGERR